MLLPGNLNEALLLSVLEERDYAFWDMYKVIQDNHLEISGGIAMYNLLQMLNKGFISKTKGIYQIESAGEDYLEDARRFLKPIIKFDGNKS